MKKFVLLLSILFLLQLFSCASPNVGSGKEGEKVSSNKGTVQEISFGKEVDIKKYVKKGKMTIFDFYSEYCPPCRRIAPLLEKLAEKRDDIVVVKVNINRPGTYGIDWRSPVARQYNLNSIPHFKIFSKDGKLEMEGRTAYRYILQLLKDEGLISF